MLCLLQLCCLVVTRSRICMYYSRVPSQEYLRSGDTQHRHAGEYRMSSALDISLYYQAGEVRIQRKWPPHRLSSLSQLPRTGARLHSIRVGSKHNALRLCEKYQTEPGRRGNSTDTRRSDLHNSHSGRCMYGVQVGGDGVVGG